MWVPVVCSAVFHTQFYKAYKFQKVQLLTDDNKRVRLERCHQLKHRDTRQRWKSILSTDEKLFPLEQAHNHQNDRSWFAEVPGTSIIVEQPAKSAVGYGMDRDLRKWQDPLIFVDKGSKSIQKCIATTFSRPSYSRELNSTSRYGLDAPAGLRVGSQGEIDSKLMQGPFFGLHHVGGMSALLTRSQPDGLQRVVHFTPRPEPALK
ncbi:hypothetical protein LAZ67_6003481 [Cordylochernes scorpioides]|uniref:Uncharacterized protein n=1 Tax=Cordylochernes scorpioides TaxID=51811 RepID=A0ABY6KKL4_9ARAC|nr:hypothetical protein LAZ67_6003481 [Cordylochernes scorpioides]